MKKYLPLLFLSASLTLTACAQTKNTTTVVKTEKPAAPVANAYDWVEISRGACYGRCPIYTVRVLPDGLVQYYGKRFVTFEGTYEKQYAPQEVAEIFSNLQTYRVDTTKDNYNVPIADLPTLTFSYNHNGQKRTINNAQFGPGLFAALAEQIDRVAKVDESWTKTGDANPE